MRAPIKMDVIRDRASLAREVDDERIENVYRLQVMNTDERAHRFTLEVGSGTDHLRKVELLTDPQPLEIPAASARLVAVRVRAEPHDARGSQPIEFVLRTVDGAGRPVALHEKSRFVVPASMDHKDSRDDH
jgi:polyferredoxin